ncbi:hypothetical protein EIP91_011053 [Steccherinum ochraceum]|uniref:Uncharacterized protein n=1 Tax=Steccherinum ochraceum TaxID=92696 RepID=A0A4R0RVL1_9APHY|nr:hypothetical protein EIP91_011053 [Steccherinum ochraceum]
MGPPGYITRITRIAMLIGALIPTLTSTSPGSQEIVRHSSRRSEGTSRAASPKVVYIDPSEYSGSDRGRSRSGSYTSHKSSSRRYDHRDYDRSYERQAPRKADRGDSVVQMQPSEEPHSPR